jgi:hypothetical protein
MSGDSEDLKITGNLALEICKGDPLVERWIKLAKDVANGKGNLTTDSIKVPLWWQPDEFVTFGPDGKAPR